MQEAAVPPWPKGVKGDARVKRIAIDIRDGNVRDGDNSISLRWDNCKIFKAKEINK